MKWNARYIGSIYKDPLYTYTHTKLVDFNDYSVKVDSEINRNHCVLSETQDLSLMHVSMQSI